MYQVTIDHKDDFIMEQDNPMNSVPRKGTRDSFTEDEKKKRKKK